MKKFVPALILAAAIACVYGNTLNHSFHFDDIPSILEKPWVRGLDKIPEFIFSFWQRPLVILSFNLNHAVSGFEVWSYHLFNITVHAVTAFCVFLLARLMQTAACAKKPQGVWQHFPLLAALLFALHPLNTQSVTYISSRSSILATLFYVAAVWCCFRGMLIKRQTDAAPEKKSTAAKALGLWAAAGVSFLLGALSKQIVWTLPAILFLFHYYFFSTGSFTDWLKRSGKWLALTGMPLAAFLAYKHFAGGGLASASETPYSWSTYLLTQTFVVPFEYFRKLLFPFNLNIDIHHPIKSDWSDPANWMGIAVLMIFIGVCIHFSRRRANADERIGENAKSAEVKFFNACLGFGLAWIGITLLPTSSVVPLLDVAVEHRTYLPMVGFCLILAAMLCRLYAAFSSSGVTVRKPTAFVPALCTALILILFAAGAVDRNAVWQNEITLWSDAKKKSPNLTRPYNNLGEAYDQRGEYDKAIPEFEAALKLNPRYFFALNNLGNVYGKNKDYSKAIHYFEKALAEKPDYPPALYNLGRALHLTGKPDRALAAYRKAVAHNPYFEEAHYNLANLALQFGLIDESVQNFQRFVAMRPEHPEARFGLGNAYAMGGKFESALDQFRQAVQLKPGFLLPIVGIANLHLQKGNVDAALATYGAALTVKPHAGIHKNLGMIYYRFKQNRPKALFHFLESLKLEPAQPQAPALQAIVAELQNAEETKS